MIKKSSPEPLFFWVNRFKAPAIPSDKFRLQRNSDIHCVVSPQEDRLMMEMPPCQVILPCSLPA